MGYMKYKSFFKKIILSLLIIIPVTVLASIPIESDASFTTDIKDKVELIEALAGAVKLSGYRCDSISGANSFVWSRGYTLTCNNFSYKYKIEDKGGKMLITVD